MNGAIVAIRLQIVADKTVKYGTKCPAQSDPFMEPGQLNPFSRLKRETV